MTPSQAFTAMHHGAHFTSAECVEAVPVLELLAAMTHDALPHTHQMLNMILQRMRVAVLEPAKCATCGVSTYDASQPAVTVCFHCGATLR